MTQPITIWDLDNCLSNDEWRIKFIDWQAKDPWTKYRTYHIMCGSDAPGNHAEFHKWLEAGAFPVFCTARPEVCRSITQLWINGNFGSKMRTHNVNHISLYMRANNDHRPSAEIKYDLAHQILQDFNITAQNVVGAFDDHQEVVQMYEHKLRIPATRLMIHSLSAYNPEGKY